MKKLWSFFFALVIIPTSCKRDTYCTDDYRMIIVQVTGDTLDEYYTVRNINQDTIRHSTDGFPPGNSPSLVVLTDSYFEHIRESESEFIFVGLIDDSVRVWEPYIIGADECHIYLVNGPAQIHVH